MADAVAAQTPLPTAELEKIIADACTAAIGTETAYDHSKVESWNTTIIQTILQSLISRTTPAATEPAHGSSSSSTAAQPAFKYIATSTIIQHIGNPAEPEKHGRRGMHSAVGAYWNTEKDGTYTSKWEEGGKKGVDVVVSLSWVAI